MLSLRPFIQIETQTSELLTVGDTIITLQSQALIVRWPRGGFVWNRPIGVIADRGGQTQRLPVVDVTRCITWSLAACTLLFSVIIALVAARHRSQNT